MAGPRPPSRFERRPRLTLALVVAALALLLAAVLEVALRATLDYHVDYYAGTKRTGTYALPYGEVRINSHGHPDAEWDLADPRPRVGWYGDSVIYGVGAGYGHRLPDLVAAARPAFQHMAFAAVGARLKDPARVAGLAERYALDRLVYAMNLNDVTPDPPPRRRDGRSADEGAVRRARAFARDHLDGLRTRSYLYNFVRLRLKNLLVRHGFEASGFRAAELEPGRSGPVLDATARRVNETARLLAARGVRFCVLLLPYEMQVSAEAARRYRELGVRWEDGFVEGSTQRALRERLDPGVEVLDGLDAFVDPAAPAASREANPLGVYFVYDRGDKIDWNHPTREGHRRLAQLVLARGFCGL
jgi:hypothetical protein